MLSPSLMLEGSWRGVMTLGSLGMSLESFPPRAGVAVAGLLFPGGNKTECITCAERRCSSTAGCAAVQVLQSSVLGFVFPRGPQTREQHALPRRSAKGSLIPKRDQNANQDTVRLFKRNGMSIASFNSK